MRIQFCKWLPRGRLVEVNNLNIDLGTLRRGCTAFELFDDLFKLLSMQNADLRVNYLTSTTDFLFSLFSVQQTTIYLKYIRHLPEQTALASPILIFEIVYGGFMRSHEQISKEDGKIGRSVSQISR